MTDRRTNITDRPSCGLRRAVMRRVVACLVLSVALAGCGDEASWQDEWRVQVRVALDTNNLAPAELIQACYVIKDDRDSFRELLLEAGRDQDEDVLTPSQRLENYGVDDVLTLGEILENNGVEYNARTYGEAIEIQLDELEALCS